MSAFDDILATMTKNCSTVSAFGKKIKFSIDGNIIYIDGTTTPPTVSQNDGPADATISAAADTFLKVVNKEINPQIISQIQKLLIERREFILGALTLLVILGFYRLWSWLHSDKNTTDNVAHQCNLSED